METLYSHDSNVAGRRGAIPLSDNKPDSGHGRDAAQVCVVDHLPAMSNH